MSAKKLYEAKDGSINVSLDIDWCRWILGIAYTNTHGPAASMKIVAMHFGPFCLAICSMYFRSQRPVK